MQWSRSWNDPAVAVAIAVVVVAALLASVAARVTVPRASKCVVLVAADTGKVTVSEVSGEELRRGTVKRTAPAVRSVDIQPAAEMMAMHASTPNPTNPTNSTNPTNPANPVMPTNPPNPTNASTRWPRVRWKTSGYVLLAASLLALCGHTVRAAEATAGYVVLVAVPALDRVLPLKNLAQELLQRGYHVGLALPEHCRHWVADLDQLEFISLGKLLGGSARPLSRELEESSDLYESYAATLRHYASLQRAMYSALREDFEEDRPELVVVDRYAFGGVDACHALEIPYVVHSPSLLLDLDAPPAYIPAPFASVSMHTPSVLARCKNSLHRLRFRLAMVQVFREINSVRSEHGLPEIHGKDDLYGHQLVLVSSMFGLDEARPIAPHVQLIGMLEPTQPTTKRLSTQFEQWIANDSVKPLVFVSFDGHVPLTPEFMTQLLNGLEHIGARIVWRIALAEQAAFDLGERPRGSVFFVRDDDATMDESLVLQLAPVSLLITPGNHYSVLQAFALGVPVLGIPFTAEQWETMNMATRTGSGIHLQKATLSDEQVHDAAMELLYRPRYAAAAFRLGEIVKTGGGTKRAADQVQSVLEFGAAHVLPMRNLQPLYKTYLVDVYAVYGLILFCSAIVLRSCFAALYHILQLAPDIHLGVALDDDGGGDSQNGASRDNSGHHHHHEVHKPAASGHAHHHSHDHGHHHSHQSSAAHGKEKHV